MGYCRIVDLIATGGMAHVYKAWHEQLEVVRALKVLKPGFTEESRVRLETEAKISANIRHQNIVEVYGVGYWNETPFIEMEYVEGFSLRQFLDKRGKVPFEFAFAVVHIVCEALHYAGSRDLTLYGKVYDSLIHRDIKPANILIDSKGIVKLADFGIARPSEASIHTVESKVMGTFAYLSPEQLNGEKLDQRCDIYALGTVLYEMITGSKAFPQKYLTELVQQKSKGCFTPIKAFSNIPKKAAALVEKCLATNRDQRYQSLIELDEELLAVLKTCSSRTPEQMIKSCLADKESGSISDTASVVQRPLWPYLMGAAGLALLIGLAFLFSIPKKAKKTSPSPVAAMATEKKDQGEISAGSSRDTLPKVEETKPSPTVVKAPTPFQSGLSAYQRKDFGTAVQMLEKAAIEQRESPGADTITLLLADCYLQTGQPLKAELVLKDHHITDPLYNCLLGQALLAIGKFQEADRTLSVAEGNKSFLGGDIKQEISYYRALARDELFLQKPNSENRDLALRSWSDYLVKYCSETPSAKCSTARNKLEQLKN